MFSLEKDTESGSGWPRHTYIFSRIECKTHFTSANTRILGGVGTTRFFLVKYKEFGGGRSLDIEIYSQNEPEVQFIYVYMVYTTILRGRWRVGGTGCILIRNSDTVQSNFSMVPLV